MKVRYTKKIRNWSLKKKIITGILTALVLLILFNGKLAWYGIKQGYGQANILLNARPVSEYMGNPAFPDTLKEKLSLVQEIRQYAFDSLGLTPNENYTTMYDQKGKPVLWVVTASEKYRLQPYEWKFPLLGTFSYKGFFDYTMALEEEQAMKAQGYETAIREVNGWSTLGYFKDPVLSNMLNRTPGSLADLIIHELTHGTLYVKDSVEYNENLASFIGHKGALKFLSYKYGTDSPEYKDYAKRHKIQNEFSGLVLEKADELEEVYSRISGLPEEQKQQEKEKAMKSIISDFKEHLSYFRKRDPKYFNKLDSINNNYFLGFRRYEQSLDDFEKEFEEEFDSDFHKYLNHLKELYPSL